MSEMELRPEEARSRFLPQWLVAPAWWRPVWAILHDSMDGLIRHDGIMVGLSLIHI